MANSVRAVHNNAMSYLVQAENFAESSENRIHSDEIAQRLGFRGALVPGVTVYGYLVHPLVAAFGNDWLAHSVADVRLLKPTYDGEQVRVEIEETDEGHTVRSYDPLGTLTAVLTSAAPQLLPNPLDEAIFDGPIKSSERVEIAWDNVVENQVFAPKELTFTVDDNARYTEQAKDASEIYREAIHPHYLLALANTSLVNEYVMPTWIHVGSETIHRKILNVGDTITIRAVTLEKWRKKGHEFVRIWVTFWRNGELTTDITHTAIFTVAP